MIDDVVRFAAVELRAGAVTVVVVGVIAACGGTTTARSPDRSSSSGVPAASGTPASPGVASSAAAGRSDAAPTMTTTTPSSAAPRVGSLGPAELFARVEGDLRACYELGRREVPTMTSGRVTFLGTVDAAGHTSCVVPSDDTGLTQQVERCMRTRLEREAYAATPSPWPYALPIAVKDGALTLGELRKSTPTIETVESHGLAEDVYDVVERLLPPLYTCVRDLDTTAGLPVVFVGGRVASTGKMTCSVASSSVPLPSSARACVERVMAGATFQPPKKGEGLVAVPLRVSRR